MPLTPGEREQVANELKKFAAGLNLTDEQKNKLRGLMEQAKEKVQAWMTANPNASKADIIKVAVKNRDQIREQAVKFLTPEQLAKWDRARFESVPGDVKATGTHGSGGGEPV